MVETGKAFLKSKLADWAEGWLLNLRQEYRAAARALNRDETSALSGYLKPDLLTAVRVMEVERISNPPFFPSLSQFGIPVPWDFSGEPGLAVVDTVVLSKPLIPEGRWLSVLFHECVHLQQFQVLGVTRMVARYVHGLFDNGFDYRKLPMERQAHELQFRFDAGLRVFSVEQEVESALVNGNI
jgi:hypothetical protein